MNSIDQDIKRDLYNFLGIPVENLTMEEIKKMIGKLAEKNPNVILSTINMNWVAQSLRNPGFKQAIIESDIVTIDGTPLKWLLKFFKYPINEVIAGSTLIEEIMHDKTKKEKPLSVFLFGGDDQVANRAFERINNTSNGLVAVGAMNPGFGNIEEMSTDEILSYINSTHPDILLVALGASKGVQWIQRNRERLNAKIISHLGATINFLAGSVKRAPKPYSKCGMEWIWRIIQEPVLFSRYLKDGLQILQVIAKYPVLLYHLAQSNKQIQKRQHPLFANHQRIGKSSLLEINTTKNKFHGLPLEQVLIKSIQQGDDIVIDAKGVKGINQSFLRIILIILKHWPEGKKIKIKNANSILDKYIRTFIQELC